MTTGNYKADPKAKPQNKQQRRDLNTQHTSIIKEKKHQHKVHTIHTLAQRQANESRRQFKINNTKNNYSVNV